MAANSKDYKDVLIWIDKVLNSCTTIEQVSNTRKLFLRFAKIYRDKLGYELINDDISMLYMKSIVIRDQISHKSIKEKIEKAKMRRNNLIKNGK